MWKKPIREITVVDIKNATGISRSSFYRNFDNILDPLSMKMDLFVKEYFLKAENAPDRIYAFFQYWDRHSVLVTSLESQGYKSVITEAFERNTDNIGEYAIALKVAIMSSLLSCWMKNGKKESIKDMRDIAFSLINSPALLF